MKVHLFLSSFFILVSIAPTPALGITIYCQREAEELANAVNVAVMQKIKEVNETYADVTEQAQDASRYQEKMAAYPTCDEIRPEEFMFKSSIGPADAFISDANSAQSVMSKWSQQPGFQPRQAFELQEDFRQFVQSSPVSKKLIFCLKQSAPRGNNLNFNLNIFPAVSLASSNLDRCGGGIVKALLQASP